MRLRIEKTQVGGGGNPIGKSFGVASFVRAFVRAVWLPSGIRSLNGLRPFHFFGAEEPSLFSCVLAGEFPFSFVARSEIEAESI